MQNSQLQMRIFTNNPKQTIFERVSSASPLYHRRGCPWPRQFRCGAGAIFHQQKIQTGLGERSVHCLCGRFGHPTRSPEESGPPPGRWRKVAFPKAGRQHWSQMSNHVDEELPGHDTTASATSASRPGTRFCQQSWSLGRTVLGLCDASVALPRLMRTSLWWRLHESIPETTLSRCGRGGRFRALLDAIGYGPPSPSYPGPKDDMCLPTHMGTMFWIRRVAHTVFASPTMLHAVPSKMQASTVALLAPVSWACGSAPPFLRQYRTIKTGHTWSATSRIDCHSLWLGQRLFEEMTAWCYFCWGFHLLLADVLRLSPHRQASSLRRHVGQLLQPDFGVATAAHLLLFPLSHRGRSWSRDLAKGHIRYQAALSTAKAFEGRQRWGLDACEGRPHAFHNRSCIRTTRCFWGSPRLSGPFSFAFLFSTQQSYLPQKILPNANGSRLNGFYTQILLACKGLGLAQEAWVLGLYHWWGHEVVEVRHGWLGSTACWGRCNDDTLLWQALGAAAAGSPSSGASWSSYSFCRKTMLHRESMRQQLLPLPTPGGVAGLCHWARYLGLPRPRLQALDLTMCGHCGRSFVPGWAVPRETRSSVPRFE